MHDPMTVAFEIKYPWRGKPSQFFPKGYRSTFITIWHVDPERDGSDDSCGWFSPKLSKEQARRMDSLAKDEAHEPHYLAFKGKKIDSPTEAETLLRQAFLIVGKVLSKEHLCAPAVRRVSFLEASAWAAEMIGNPVDNFRSSLAFLPGWHSNFEEDRESDREQSARELFGCIARYICRERRPWYKRPRWHIWHWQIQVHPLQDFKRWAFSRCAKCNRRFPYGYSPVTTQWCGTGPRWFKSEDHTYHSECCP